MSEFLRCDECSTEGSAVAHPEGKHVRDGGPFWLWPTDDFPRDLSSEIPDWTGKGWQEVGFTTDAAPFTLAD